MRLLGVSDEGRGPAVLLLHGIPGSARSWDAVAQLLANDHRVLAADLLGFGASPRPREPALAERQAAALAATLDRMGVERATVVGHDFGGPVALHLQRGRPDLFSGLLLSATNAFPDTPIPLPIAAVTWPLVGRLAEQVLFAPPALRLMLRRGAGSPRPQLDADVYIGDRQQARAIRSIFATSLRELDALYRPLAESLAAVHVPASVVWGACDPFFSVAVGKRTAHALPDAQLVVLEGCGHFVPAERPKELAREIRQLVRRAGGQPASQRWPSR